MYIRTSPDSHTRQTWYGLKQHQVCDTYEYKLHNTDCMADCMTPEGLEPFITDYMSERLTQEGLNPFITDYMSERLTQEGLDSIITDYMSERLTQEGLDSFITDYMSERLMPEGLNPFITDACLNMSEHFTHDCLDLYQTVQR